MKKFIVIILSCFISTVCSTTIFAQNTEITTSDKLQIQDENALNLQKKAQEFTLLWEKESIEEALKLFLESARKWKELRNFSNAAFCLREAGQLQIILGNKEIAVGLFQESLENSKKSFDKREQIKTLSEFSLLLFDIGKFEQSKNFANQALELSGKIQDEPTKASVLHSSGESLYFQDELKKSQINLEKSIAIWKKIGDLRNEARSLISLGYTQTQQSDYESALISFTSALKNYETSKDIRGQAISLKAVGTAYNLLEQPQKALEFYIKSIELFPEDLDFSEKAVIYNGIGSIYEYYGDWNASINNRKKALELFQKDHYKYGELATLASLGNNYYLKNDNETAREYFSKAEKPALAQNNKFYLSVIFRGFGNIFFSQKNYADSIINFQKALSYSNLESGERQISLINKRLGEVYLTKKEFQPAKHYFSVSLDLNQKVKDSFAQAETLYHLSLLNNFENNREKALDLAEKSVEITENLTSDVLNSKLKSTYFSNVFDRYELYINLLMKMHEQSPNEDFAIRALQAAEKSRSRSMLETLTLSDAKFTKDANPETVKREKEIRSLLNLKSDKLTDLLSHNAEKNEIDKLDNEINELEHELEEIKATLKQNSPIYSAIKNPEPFDVKEFQNRILDENSILLEFSLGEMESYLWLVGKNEISSYVLPSREEIESKVENLRELIAARVQKKDETIEDYQARILKADQEFHESARQLSNELFGQISGKLANKRLIIVPDGKLHYFPVSALPLPDSTDDTPILLSNEVVYEPSASTLALISKNEKQTEIAAKNLLVFSDPVFSEDDSRFPNKAETVQNLTENSDSADKFRFAESLNSLPRLTESKDEGNSILDIAGSSKTDIFTGFAATRERFLKTNVSEYKILHFATHGLIKEDRPELSGIIFSRFNENREKLDEVVRLQDIYGLNLNADLVVLSACETGIGKEEKGEGLLSLNNGFLQVGAKTVLSSLWKVEDAATVELMKNFYKILADEKTTSAKALQKAQIKMWESGRYKSPFYWAAFTVQGDYTRKPDISTGFSPFFLIAVLSVFFSIGGFSVYYFVRRRGQNRLRERADLS